MGDYQAAEKRFEVSRRMLEVCLELGIPVSVLEQIAKAGILTGISMMPILPGLCDTDENLEATIRCTANHGGTFVITGGLSRWSTGSASSFSECLRDRFPDLLPLYERMYPAALWRLAQRRPACRWVGGSASRAANTASRTGCRGRSSPATSAH